MAVGCTVGNGLVYIFIGCCCCGGVGVGVGTCKFNLALYFFNFLSSSSTCAVGCIFIIVGSCGSLFINPLG